MEPRSHAISLLDSDTKIRQFLELRDQLNQESLRSQMTPAAQTYIGSNTLSFAFHKDQFDELFYSVQNSSPVANGIRIYLAADEIGKPTLIIIPCHIGGEAPTATNIMSAAWPGGMQYPHFLTTVQSKKSYTSESGDESTCY